jgi:AraC-like DNA-binding protein
MLLHTTDIPVRVIARRVGMADQQYFNKQFRRFAGVSPSRWREESRKGKGAPL